MTAEADVWKVPVDDDDDDILFFDWQQPLEGWMKNNSPLNVRRSFYVAWIMILAENVATIQDEGVDIDYYKLLREWDLLRKSGKALNFLNMCNLGHKCDVRYGMWITHMKTGPKVKSLWKKLARQFVDGTLTDVANEIRISPHDPYDEPDKKRVIIVFNADFADEDAIFAIEKAMRRIGFKTDLKYKPGIYNHIDIAERNVDTRGPAAYFSQYDSVRKTSRIIPLWQNTIVSCNRVLKDES